MSNRRVHSDSEFRSIERSESKRSIWALRRSLESRIESLESRVSINTSESLSKSVRLLLENRKIVSKFFDSSIICFCYFNPTVKPICWKFAFQWRNVSIETFEWKLSSKNFSANPCSRTTTLQTFRNRPSALLQTPLKLSGSFEWEFFSVLKIDEFSIQKFWFKTLSNVQTFKPKESLSGSKMSNRVALSKGSLGRNLPNFLLKF